MQNDLNNVLWALAKMNGKPIDELNATDFPKIIDTDTKKEMSIEEIRTEISNYDELIEDTYKTCMDSNNSVFTSKTIGCFYCENTMTGDEKNSVRDQKGQKIKLCPKCGIDALVSLDHIDKADHNTILNDLHFAYFDSYKLNESIYFGDSNESK